MTHAKTNARRLRRRAGWITAAVVAALALLPLQANAQCTGDCDGNDTVAINELIIGVNIALGAAPVTTCPPFDVNSSGSVEINELVAAVNNALAGCGTPSPAPATATATPTISGNTPTRTPTLPTGGNCGDGIVDLGSGETCDDGNRIEDDGCPANCRVVTCAASEQRFRVAVNFAANDLDVFLQTLTIFLRYPDGTLSIPARDDSPPVIARVTSDIFSVTPRDFDYALRVLLVDPTTLGYHDGTAMTVVFDVCQGASAPALGAITCTIEDGTDMDFMTVPGDQITCTLAPG
jgi:cysteine-rich repeat protein